MAARTALRRSAARPNRAAQEALVDEQNAVKGSEGVAGYEPANGGAFRVTAEGGMPLHSKSRVVIGRDFLSWLAKAGIVPELTRRVVIEASVGDAVRIYAELYGSGEMLSVEPPDALRGAVIQTTHVAR